MNSPITAFLSQHVPQLTAVVGLVSYGLARNKFTPGGIVAGIAISIVHMLHPWPAFFWLLFVFVGVGVGVTKVGHEAKSHLTQSSTGSGGEGPRTSDQVLANSGFASLLILTHGYLLTSSPFISSNLPIAPGLYAPVLLKVLPIGIVAQYAAVAADTCSSELGILATSSPRLITAPWKKVPKGTNGGVTPEGLLYGGIGSIALTLVAALALYSSAPRIALSLSTVTMIAVVGLGGSLIDSVLGAVVQATVTDKRSGKVVEGPGGTRVKVSTDGSRTIMGLDLLTNNGVNFVMAALSSILGMLIAYSFDLGIGER